MVAMLEIIIFHNVDSTHKIYTPRIRILTHLLSNLIHPDSIEITQTTITANLTLYWKMSSITHFYSTALIILESV